MFDIVKRLFGNLRSNSSDVDVDTPMRRWSDDELADVKEYLESTDPKDWSHDDHLKAVDFVVQRYLPKDEPITQAQWGERRDKFSTQIAANLEKANSGVVDEPAWIRANREQDLRRELLHSSYFVARKDFQTIILPALSQFSFIHELKDLTESDWDLLWEASETESSEMPWSQRHKIRDARDALVGQVRPETVEIGTMLRKNYEVLRRAQNAGCQKVKLIVDVKCRCYGSVFNGTHVEIAAALDAFSVPNGSGPLLPPPQAACLRSESPKCCSIHMMPIEPPIDPDGIFDPSFQTWMDKRLGREIMVPSNWKLQLSER